MEIQQDIEPSAARRAETRIPKCTKYELSDGYRLVLQRGTSTRPWLPLSLAPTIMSIRFWTGIKGTCLTKNPDSFANCGSAPLRKPPSRWFHRPNYCPSRLFPISLTLRCSRILPTRCFCASAFPTKTCRPFAASATPMTWNA